MRFQEPCTLDHLLIVVVLVGAVGEEVWFQPVKVTWLVSRPLLSSRTG